MNFVKEANKFLEEKDNRSVKPKNLKHEEKKCISFDCIDLS